MSAPNRKPGEPPTCLDRRAFLILGGAGTAAAVVLLSIPGCGSKVAARTVPYPRKRIARLADLREGVPVELHYPHDHTQCTAFLVKLGVEAGGGVGPEKDVVAFSSICTHQGGPLRELYQGQGRHRLAGPCPMHLTTFDLTRHGMVVSGHATQSLPQVVLEVSEGDVWAKGMLGLLYGFPANIPDPSWARS